MRGSALKHTQRSLDGRENGTEGPLKHAAELPTPEEPGCGKPPYRNSRTKSLTLVEVPSLGPFPPSVVRCVALSGVWGRLRGADTPSCGMRKCCEKAQRAAAAGRVSWRLRPSQPGPTHVFLLYVCLGRVCVDAPFRCLQLCFGGASVRLFAVRWVSLRRTEVHDAAVAGVEIHTCTHAHTVSLAGVHADGTVMAV